MDPNTNLAEQLRLAQVVVDSDGKMTEEQVLRLADLVLALDEWIRLEGFLPEAWNEAVLQRAARIAKERAEAGPVDPRD